MESFPLGLEVNSFCIPSSDGVREGVHEVDLPHESLRDTGGEVLNEDIMVIDSGESDIIFEQGDVISQGRMKDILFVFDHLDGREPGNCIAFDVSVFEEFFKLCYKILKGSEGKDGEGRGEAKLLEGGCPCGCRSFVHI